MSFLKCLAASSLSLLVASAAFAQQDGMAEKYRRASVFSIMLKTDGGALAAQMNKVAASFDTLPIPDRYNDHNLDFRIVSESDVKSIELSEQEKTDSDEDAAKLLKYLQQKSVAGNMIAKWYDYSKSKKTDGQFAGYNFDFDLISERGLQSASQEDLAAARSTMAGTRSIMDAAASDLIPKTFVVVNKFTYLNATDIIAQVTAEVPINNPMAAKAAQVAAAKMAEVMSGYFVAVKSYLFQLEWNPELQTKFESTYFVDNIDDAKVAEFITSGDYKLKYLGKASKFAPAAIGLNSDNEDKLIGRATARSVDAAFASLQKDFEQFRPMAALHVIDGKLAAYVGLKEGVKAGDKFDVFELQFDSKTFAETYKKVGTIKVDKKTGVWDNRAGAGETIEGAATDKDEEGAGADLKCTFFSGKTSKFGEGMLIRAAN